MKESGREKNVGTINTVLEATYSSSYFAMAIQEPSGF